MYILAIKPTRCTDSQMYSKNKFEVSASSWLYCKNISHDARSPECQVKNLYLINRVFYILFDLKTNQLIK